MSAFNKLKKYDDTFKVKRVEYISKTFRLPMNLIQELRTVAQRKEVSLNSLVAQCCEYALEKYDDMES